MLGPSDLDKIARAANKEWVVREANARQDWMPQSRTRAWQTHIPEAVRAVWPNLTYESRVMLIITAQEIADRES